MVADRPTAVRREDRIEFPLADLRDGGRTMSKGMDRKKETKKKAGKSLEEKRAAKREKRQNRGR